MVAIVLSKKHWIGSFTDVLFFHGESTAIPPLLEGDEPFSKPPLIV